MLDERRSNGPAEQEGSIMDFDCIIIGARARGSVLANRLDGANGGAS
jgi:hypothetical protein